MPGPLETMLAVQEHDLAVDRLLHKRQTLQERAELAALEQEAEALESRLAESASRRDELERRQTRLEEEVAAVERRITEVDRRLYSGEVSASRELQAMSAEVEALKRRRSDLEDQELAVMEEREPVDAEVAEIETQRAALAERAGRVMVAIAEAEAAIDAEVDAERAARAELMAAVPADLAAQYDRLRARLGGIGAARLVNGACTGCHLALPATELDRIRRAQADAVLHCEQCGRILVP
jgi:predicted  nucleic acid-binding Zn-ribbon protein